MRQLIDIAKHKGLQMLLLVLLFSARPNSPAAGQSSEMPPTYLEADQKADLFDDAEWKEWSVKRQEAKYLEDLRKVQKDEKKKSNQKDSPLFNKGLMKAFATFLLIIIGIVVAFFLVRQLMGLRLRPRNRKIKRQAQLVIDLEEIEDRLEEVALEDYIEQATREGNYGLAIRLYYLEALKILSLNQHIKWKKDKTNKDYLQEMRDSDHIGSFQQITRLFERVWYGNQSINLRVFQEIAPNFERFIDTIKTQNLTTTK